MFLPPEIKLNIADYLDPLTSINFGITCKEHWKLCQPLLNKHTKGFAEAPIVTAYNALDILRATIQDPSKGWYIGEISFRERWDQPPTAPMEDLGQLQDAARQVLSLYPHLSADTGDDCLVTQVEHGLAAGSPDSAVAVLIHHLPNLKTFRLTMSTRGSAFEALIERIAIEYGNMAKRSSLPFQRLHTASLVHHDSESCVSADWALPFLRIPSLRTFAARMMGGNFYHGERPREIPLYPRPQSNIEEFFFIDCQFDAAVMEYLLSCTQALKRFTYDAGGAIVNDSLYDAKVVLKALAEHGRHSLECLVLNHYSYHEEETMFRGYCEDDKERPAEADLSMFTQLHSVSANWAMLWPELSSTTSSSDDPACSPHLELSCTPLDIRDILPSSLTTLHLSGVFDKEEWDGVVGPLATPNGGTPSLTMDRMRVEGRVQNKDNYRQDGTIAAVGGWDTSEEKRLFGSASRAWLERAWAPSTLFQEHGW